MIKVKQNEEFPDPLDHEQSTLLEWPSGSVIAQVYICRHHRFKTKEGKQHHSASWDWLYQRGGFKEEDNNE